VRLPTTATAWIAVVTALCWIVAALLGLSEQAANAMGFIPERWSGAQMMGPAVPAYLTPLSATLAHAGILHLAFNLLILVWCGTQVERVLGASGAVERGIIGLNRPAPDVAILFAVAVTHRLSPL